MTDQKLLEVIARYEQLGLETWNDDLVHVSEMLPQMRVFVAEGRREKLMRWLGWVQAVLVLNDFYTLEEVKEHNMPDSHATV